MNEEKFTDDNEFVELKKLLKNLPKVNAPDNFEFNLMSRIQNKNFEVKPEKKKGWLSWSLTPAIAFAASVFLIFSIFFREEEPVDNPWNSLPRLMEENITETVAVDKNQFENPSSNKRIYKRSNSKNQPIAKSITKEFPFAKESSIDFDEYLRTNVKRTSEVGPQLAGSQSPQLSQFDGFFLHKRESTNNKSDSIKKDNDSLRSSGNR